MLHRRPRIRPRTDTVKVLMPPLLLRLRMIRGRKVRQPLPPVLTVPGKRLLRQVLLCLLQLKRRHGQQHSNTLGRLQPSIPTRRRPGMDNPQRLLR